MNKVALVVGSSGLVGGELVNLLIEDSHYSKIICPVRRPSSHESEKTEFIVGDVMQPNTFDLASVDEVFICIGTTRNKTPDKGEYRDIDYGIPVDWAKWSAENKVQKYVVVSAMGANEKSSIFYNKLKGEMENEVFKILPDNSYSVRPSLLLGDRKEKRVGEGLAISFYKTLGFLIPKKYKGITAKSVAKAMIYICNNPVSKRVFESIDLQKFANLD